MAQALYRTYRSKSLDEVVGQRHITDVLQSALKNGRISHAYLFTGPRGVGKTSVARILAHEINGLPYDESTQHLDIIEIDAASNNGVEDIRDLREKVQLAPVSASKKVYIIDEVHMLSKAAFNALLKTLEEPPEHVVFILATTDVDKLPATIVSRTQRYGFRAINPTDAVTHLRHIADEEKIKISDEALLLVARRGDGSFRDSISILDQLSSVSEKEIDAQLVESALGLAPDTLVVALIDAAQQHDIAALAARLDEAMAAGIGAGILTDQLLHALREKVVQTPRFIGLIDALLDVPKSSQPDLKLFTVLGSFQAHSPTKAAALIAPAPEVSATIESLAKKAVQPRPTEPKPVPTAAIKKPTPNAETPPTLPPKTKQTQPFDWTNLVEHTRKQYIALFSVLSKCQFTLEADVLTLYTGNAFYKKKLDDPKYSTHLYESLAAVGCGQVTVETLPESLPLKDSQAAAVAAIMGGGEEVAVSDNGA